MAPSYARPWGYTCLRRLRHTALSVIATAAAISTWPISNTRKPQLMDSSPLIELTITPTATLPVMIAAIFNGVEDRRAANRPITTPATMARISYTAVSPFVITPPYSTAVANQPMPKRTYWGATLRRSVPPCSVYPDATHSDD